MSPTANNSTAPLRQFGNYEIIRKLGRSMTDVYLATDVTRNMRVVLKLIEQSGDYATQIAIEAERRGAQIQRQLRSIDARILEIYDFGEEGGYFFVAMEHFEGLSVAELLDVQKRLDPVRAARYAWEVLQQLQILHSFVSDIDGRRRAVVHGDVKPSNIQVGANETVRLLDFGIAKMITETHNLTSHNLGSPTYCSPERLAKAQVDAQSDLWALAVSLYEMVSGTVPYQAVSTRKLESLIQSRRPPRALPDTCPPRLRAILFKALAADIQRRYASAEEFAADLRAFLENRPAIAERETQPSWDANETIRNSAPQFSAAKIRPSLQAIRAHAAWAWLLLGVPVVILAAQYYKFQNESRPLRDALQKTRVSSAQIEAEWQMYKQLEHRNGLVAWISPAPQLQRELRSHLLSAASATVDAYRNSSDPVLTDFDWSSARLALNYAIQLGATDSETRARLALCNGYLNLIANPKLPAAQRSETEFQVAAADAPRSPDAHLALARLYIYAFRNIGLALGQFHEAEGRGFHLGPRELEQEADGYLFRAEFELGRARRVAAASQGEAARWVKQSSDDIERARALYEPLYGFSRVSRSLDQLHADRRALAEVRTAAESVPKTKTKIVRSSGRKVATNYGRH